MQQSQQSSTAGRGVNDTRYRAARQNNGDFEEDDEQGALTPGPTGLGTNDPDVDCGRATDTTDENRQDEEFIADGAGHCGGELRGDMSALESWTRTVQQHRTGLVSDGRRPAGSSGKEPAHERGSIRRRLKQIMEMPDEESNVSVLLFGDT